MPVGISRDDCTAYCLGLEYLLDSVTESTVLWLESDEFQSELEADWKNISHFSLSFLDCGYTVHFVFHEIVTWVKLVRNIKIINMDHYFGKGKYIFM
jgi:hypothetical protein